MRKWWGSLTVRLVVASLAWTIGLLYLTHLTSVFVMFGHDALLRFGPAMLPSTVIAIILMAVGAVIVRAALKTFSELKRQLLDVYSGREHLVRGVYMSEVQPLVSTLNTLLEHQDTRVREALTKAGDLAHGLKTPLAVLSHEAERAAADGHHDLAATLVQQVERMRRHIDYHLAHARAAASGAMPGAHCSVSESAHAIARTLQRLHAQRGLTIDVQTPLQHVVRGQRADLDEMLGNLLDNACKWARTRIVITSSTDGGVIVIDVDDDGPGIPDRMRAAVLQRGVRADEAAPGSGFGLAIVRDLVELYGGSIGLEQSALGGLRARLRLPRVACPDSGAVQEQ